MQSQQRTPSQQHVRTIRPSVQQDPKLAQVRPAPIVLDTQALRHVAGGTDAPKKYW
jgi:hypothetical protein